MGIAQEPRNELRRPKKGDFLPPGEALYRSNMLRRFGLLYFLSGIGWLLRRIRLPDNAAENIRRAHARGPVVYVLHTRSVTDWLALNRVLNGRRLPLADFSHDLRARWFAPAMGIPELWAALRHRWSHGSLPGPVRSGWYTEAVSQGMTSLIFLQGRGNIEALVGARDANPLEALLAEQERSERRIQLVPIVVIWNRRPENLRTELGRFLLGSQDEPTVMEKLFAVATRNPDALVQAGAPVDLQEFTERFVEEPPERRLRRLRILLRRFLYRESRIVKGPRVRSRRWLHRIVLQSSEVKELVARESQATGRSADAVRTEVTKILDKIAARISFPVARTMAFIARQLFRRVYSGVDIREEDLEKIRQAFRKGTPVLVPCHRSHLDYILISSQMYEHDIVIPHVVAGDNLDFLPAGPILRRCGAFFVKRTFAGDRLFPVVFDRYLRQLVRDGVPLEFFIEGGRSRTGKLLRPKLGVLKMVLDASAHNRDDREVTFLPIGISYEEIAERKALARELAGGEKKKEDLGEMVKAGRVLRRRMGKVYLRVGEPLTAREVFEPLDEPWAELGRGQVRETLRATGEVLMYRISKAMVMLPTGLVSMALLALEKRGMRMSELQARVSRLYDLLIGEGAVPAESFGYGGWVVEEALQRLEKQKLVQRLSDQQGDIIHVPESSRVSLDHHKNGLMHFIAPISLYASAVLAAGPADDDEVFRLFQMQIFLFRYELILDPEASVEQHAVLATEALLEVGALVRNGDEIVVGDRAILREIAGLTHNFVESYLLVLWAAQKLRSRDIPAKELPKRVQEVGRGYLAVEQLKRSESLSLENLKNAIYAFREERLLQPRSSMGGLQYDEAGLGQYIGDLSRLLDE